MGLVAVESILKAAMGLSVGSVGPATIARAVQERLACCSLADSDAYVERLRSSPAELQALIEAVVVPETWFFRDAQAFAALARLMLREWMPAHPDGVCSVLSLPCSTGEEPYSMAMALLDAHIPPGRFRIDAVDISTRNIEHAERAVYRRNSFRDQELGFRDRHFDPAGSGYHVKATVRRQVRFRQGNLFEADLLPGSGIYDAIFCRNVLIYFDRPTQDRALAVLNRLLHASGMLFVAPAETALPSSHGMVSSNEPMAYAFRKAQVGTATARLKSPAVIKPPDRSVLPTRLPARQLRPPVAAPPPAGALVPRPSEQGPDLAEATCLADAGSFAEAAGCCEEYLRRRGPSAAAFYLLGLVRDATGQHTEAAASYRKALYLDPGHRDAQIHLALLIERQGDAAGARVLRNRARRLEQAAKDTK